MSAERVISVDELPIGQLRCLQVGGLPICLAHAEDGNFYAVDDLCSHEHASLSDGWIDGTEIECPRHNAMFDLRTGEPTSLPATDPIRTYPVTVRGDDVFLTVDTPARAAD